MLERIATTDGRLKSYATVVSDRALAAARTAERQIGAGEYLGPLHGVPIAVKDSFYTRGIRTMGGLAVLREHVPDYDATVVSKLKAAGAVILGKLNLTEGALPGYQRGFDIVVLHRRGKQLKGVSATQSRGLPRPLGRWLARLCRFVVETRTR